jgi:RNA polymerase sigma-70 factor (ECF subfamily)
MSVKRDDMVPALVQPTVVTPYDEDAIYVERSAKGDQGAFEHLYAKYHLRVVAIARGILLNTEEAADVAQEVFTLAFRHLARFDRRSRFSTWLFRIAVNRSIQEARRGRNNWRYVELNEALAKSVAEEQQVDPRIYRALVKMKPADRAAITLFYWEELSVEQLAEHLRCSANAAKTRLYRARERFRMLYEGLQKA